MHMHTHTCACAYTLQTYTHYTRTIMHTTCMAMSSILRSKIVCSLAEVAS